MGTTTGPTIYAGLPGPTDASIELVQKVGTLADKRDVSTTLTMVGGKLVSSSGGRMFIGTNTVTFTATDTFQNTGTCTREVEVLDCAPPLVVCKDITAKTVRSRAFTQSCCTRCQYLLT